MKIVEHKNMQIDNYGNWFEYVHKQHPEILGAEWNKEKKLLKVFYEDNATELTEEALKNIEIPTILRFRKKVTPPKLDAATVSISATENEFTVETFDAEAVRKEVKQKLTDFEETK
jgi:hypothetical protein